MRSEAPAYEPDLEIDADFLRGGARPPVQQLDTFIDAHKHEHELVLVLERRQRRRLSLLAGHPAEPLLRGHSHHHRGRAVTSSGVPRSKRVPRSNYGVYGAREVHPKLPREAHQIARCAIQRLMSAAACAA